MKNRIVILGTGNVAQALASAIHGSSWSLVQIYGRDAEKARRLAEENQCTYTASLSDLMPADMYLVSVSDQAIATVTAAMHVDADSIVAHTAGSIPWSAISPHIRHRGIFYPLQTFTTGRVLDFNAIPLFVTGNEPETISVLLKLGSALAQQVTETDENTLRQLHLSAVFACNFTNHMYALAQRLLAETGLAASVLNPLIAETAAKTIDAAKAEVPATRVQAGPAVRGDRVTQEKQQALLEKYPELNEIYKIISKSIWETSKKT